MELDTLDLISARVHELLKLYCRRDELKTPAVLEACDYLKKALAETRHCLMSVKQAPNVRHQPQEQVVSLRWQETAGKILPLDSELGRHCQAIGCGAWSDPGCWNYQRLIRAIVVIENLEKALEHLTPVASRPATVPGHGNGRNGRSS